MCSVGEDEWTALVRVEPAMPEDGQGGGQAEGGGDRGHKAAVLAQQVLEIEIRDRRARLLDGGGGLGALIALKQRMLTYADVC